MKPLVFLSAEHRFNYELKCAREKLAKVRRLRSEVWSHLANARYALEHSDLSPDCAARLASVELELGGLQ